jgi:RNA polymerase sigma-70 factor (ECF subfamily)
LPRRLRDVVVLHLVADLPVAEVATVAGIPVGTVKRRLYEARALLRLDWLEIG